MHKKQSYTAPEAEIIPLQAEGAFLTGSANAIGVGPSITFLDEQPFETFF